MPEALVSIAVAPSRVYAAGTLAFDALRRSQGFVTRVPGFEATGYRLAAGEIIWLGESGPEHPRTVLVANTSTNRLLRTDARLIFSLPSIAETVGTQGPQAIKPSQSAARAILGVVHEGNPAGLACLLAGRIPAFPLSHRASAAHQLAAGCKTGDAHAVEQAARQLIGAGPGLTPSGDDFVGGALFALRAGGLISQEWPALEAAVARFAATRTHRISAALLSDLACGQSYPVLHHLFNAVAMSDDTLVRHHARELVGIGSSSGWDILAGMVAALFGTLDLK